MARNSALTIWSWPWELAQAYVAAAETLMAAPAVIAARMPMIADAVAGP